MPAQHGFTGWWVYLPRVGERSTIYEWRRTADGKSLSELGVQPKDVFLSRPYPGKASIDCQLFMPELLKDSLPTLYSESGGALVEGFDDIEQGVEKAVSRVRHANEKSLTLLYWNLIDVSAHAFGVNAPETAESVKGLDVALGQLAQAVEGKARLIVTADHGHLDVSDYVSFGPSHTLAGVMNCTQSGEPRAAYMHVAGGQHDRFEDEFRAEFGQHFILAKSDDLIDMKLFGPYPPSPDVRPRFGDFTAISRGGEFLTSRASTDSVSQLKATHGGLTPEEMMVPVLLA